MTEQTQAFAEYVKEHWLTVGRDDRGWYVTHDAKWAMKKMRAEGWIVRLTGESELMADDTFRQYFTVTIRTVVEVVQ